MKLELSKKEIEVILELMEYGRTFLFSHGTSDYKPVKKDKKRININELEKKLKRAIKQCKSNDVPGIKARAKDYKSLKNEIRPYIKPKKYRTHSTAGKWVSPEDLKFSKGFLGGK